MKFISIDDYLMGRIKIENMSPEWVGNMNTLIPKINDLLEKFGEYRKCNSGFRTQDDQMRINPKAPNSNHCIAAAIDLFDANGELHTFLKLNPKVLEDLDLFCEERQGSWQHLQIIRPKSGHRWFNP